MILAGAHTFDFEQPVRAVNVCMQVQRFRFVTGFDAQLMRTGRHLQRGRLESVALAHIPVLHAAFEPAHALL